MLRPLIVGAIIAFVLIFAVASLRHRQAAVEAPAPAPAQVPAPPEKTGQLVTVVSQAGKYTAALEKAGAERLNEQAVAYVRESITHILTDWYAPELWHRCSEKLCGGPAQRAFMEKAFKEKSSLGAITRIEPTTGEIQLQPYMATLNNIWGRYITHVIFEHGDEFVQIEVLWNGEGWEIMNFSFNVDPWRPYRNRLRQ